MSLVKVIGFYTEDEPSYGNIKNIILSRTVDILCTCLVARHSHHHVFNKRWPGTISLVSFKIRGYIYFLNASPVS